MTMAGVCTEFGVSAAKHFKVPGESDTGSAKRTKVAQAFPDVGSKMLFLFDFGDDWRFQVTFTGRGRMPAEGQYFRLVG
jgi:hypothetical protein